MALVSTLRGRWDSAAATGSQQGRTFKVSNIKLEVLPLDSILKRWPLLCQQRRRYLFGTAVNPLPVNGFAGTAYLRAITRLCPNSTGACKTYPFWATAGTRRETGK